MLQDSSNIIKVNTDYLSGLRDLFLSFGIVPILGVAVTGVLLILLYKWISVKIVSNLKEKDERIDGLTRAIAAMNVNNGIAPGLTNSLTIEAMNDLTKHPVFSNIDYLLTVRINQTSFSTKKKHHIFKDYVDTKYSIFSDSLKTFLVHNKNYEISRNELKSRILHLFISLDEASSSKISELEIPYIALVELNKSAQMGDRFIHSSINTFSDSMNYRSAEDIIYAILNLSVQVIELVFNDMIINLEKLNGELDSIEYPINK